MGADAELGERKAVGEADMCRLVGGPICTDTCKGTVSIVFAGNVVSSVDENTWLGIKR